MRKVIIICIILLFITSCAKSEEPSIKLPSGDLAENKCGNLNCESGESPEKCPEDCGIAEEMNKPLCESAGGHWTNCGSPCVGTDAEMCIEVCEQQCECGGIAGWSCPEGYNCRLTGLIADEMGKCILS